MSADSNRSGTLRWLLAAGIVGASGWAFYSVGIAPLREREQTARNRIAELSGQVEGAQKAIEEIRAIEPRAAAARVELDRWSQESPATSAMVWFPERLKEHFGRFGIPESATRLNTTKDEPELPGYQRTYWRVALPFREADRGLSGVMLAVAELEQQDPSVKVLDFVVQSNPTNPSLRIAGINVAALVRK